MPVHSKPYSGRAKNAPPLLGPKPYQKPPQSGPHNALVTPGSPVTRNFTDGLTPGSPVTRNFTNGPTNIGHTHTESKSNGPVPLVNESTNDGPVNKRDSQSVTSVQFSVLRRPAEKKPDIAPKSQQVVRKPDKVPKSPQVVRFGAAEIFGGEKYDDDDDNEGAFSRRLEKEEKSSAAATKQTTKQTRQPTQSTLSGAQALQACEEHTDWANEVLTRHNLLLISDLRKSIGDGFTLPTILEIIGGVSLSCVKTSPVSKEERVTNILHCLKFLCKRGVNVNGIEPSDIEDGHLKSVLQLVGNIRQHFKHTYKPDQNGYSHHVLDSPEVKSPVESTMPGTMKLPGAVPTPFVPQGQRKSKPEPVTRKSGYQGDEMLPGVLGRDINSNDTSKPHFNIISTTEIGTNGVAQHGVDERKQHFATSNTTTNNNRGMVIRHPNARTNVPSVHDQSALPPSVTQRAWTGSPRPQHNNVNGSSMSPTVEDRLKNLLGNGSSRSSSRDNLGYYGGGFHGGSSEILDDDDGEILVVPGPMSRNSADFETAMLGEHGYGPGYRPPGTNGGQHTRQRSQQGYVPSKPSERVQGSRAEVIISRPPSAIAFRKTAPSRVPQGVPGSMPGNNLDNGPYNHRSPSPGGNRGGNQQGGESKSPRPLKAGSNDLRNAWNKLYGTQTQPPPPPYGSMRRGDQLRSSYNNQSQQQRPGNNSSQQSVSFAQPQSPMSSRPVSAPAPAHMQAYFHTHDQNSQGQGQSHSQDNLDNQGQGHAYTSHQRESPMGQSSSTQGHLDESSSSQQSRLSQEQVPKHLQVQTSTDNNYGKLSQSSHSSLSQPSPNSPGSPNYAIGPASKYPDNPGSRPSSARKPTGSTNPASPQQRQNRPRLPLPHQSNEQVIRNDLRHSNKHQNNFQEDLTTALQAASKEHKNLGGYSFDDSHDRSHDQSHDMSLDFQNRSIFDYNPPSRSESTGSVTPPLPPLSPTNTPPDSPQMELNSNLPRSLSATNVTSAFNKFDEADGKAVQKKKHRRTSEVNYRMERQPKGKKLKNKGFRSRGASLNDVMESGTDTESNLSFDIDDTILTVESHDTDQPHPAGDILSSQEVTNLRDQLHHLEFRYSDLQTKVHDRPVGHRMHQPTGPGKGQGFGPPPIGRQRRWSIGSSDTSSFRREAKFKPGKQIHHKHYSREFKNINKRFQRLESHVVTLARSVAHLSSELRTHNTMVNDLDTVKRELRELRENPSRPFPNMIDRTMAEQERFRDWVPSLTNPKRVNKLTKFFGSEPPLLELFLEKLGYKKYISNFQSEHIGMIELPYMTEDRLEKIGVPMGPRIRILQEAQSCFRHENMNIYVV